MLAATPPIQMLRPQALPVKFIAVGALSAALNVPCGMWREHTEKFSVQWIIAVHASIPFIALLRKAVIMPKIAIACTIACAVAGQTLGARLERERLHKAAAIDENGGVQPMPSGSKAEQVTASEDLVRLQASARKAGRRKRASKDTSAVALQSSGSVTERTAENGAGHFDLGLPLCDGSPQWLTEVVSKMEGFKQHFSQPLVVSS